MACTSAALLKLFATGCCAPRIFAALTIVMIQAIRTVTPPLNRIQTVKKKHAVCRRLYDIPNSRTEREVRKKRRTRNGRSYVGRNACASVNTRSGPAAVPRSRSGMQRPTSNILAERFGRNDRFDFADQPMIDFQTQGEPREPSMILHEGAEHGCFACGCIRERLANGNGGGGCPNASPR